MTSKPIFGESSAMPHRRTAGAARARGLAHAVIECPRCKRPAGYDLELGYAVAGGRCEHEPCSREMVDFAVVSRPQGKRIASEIGLLLSEDLDEVLRATDGQRRSSIDGQRFTLVVRCTCDRVSTHDGGSDAPLTVAECGGCRRQAVAFQAVPAAEGAVVESLRHSRVGQRLAHERAAVPQLRVVGRDE